MNKASAKGANTSAACEAATQIMTAAMIPTETLSAEFASHTRIPGSAEMLPAQGRGACARTGALCTGDAFPGREGYREVMD